jgi:hypothetical protein
MAKIPIPDLRVRLDLLFLHRRNQRIDNYTSLEKEMGIYQDQRVTSFVRDGQPAGIPSALLGRFLSAFGLTESELLLPLDEFRQLLQSASSRQKATPGWHGRERMSPHVVATVNPASQVCFAWPDLSVSFVSTQPAALGASERPVYRDLQRREDGATVFVFMQHDFRIEVQPAKGRKCGMLGLIEGARLRCFLLPHEEAPRNEKPFYFDVPGRHTLWVLLLGDLRPSSLDVPDLLSCDDLTCQTAAERLFNSACARAEGTVPVLRARFDVVM